MKAKRAKLAVLGLGLFGLTIIAFGAWHLNSSEGDSKSVVRVQLAYPITSLDPTYSKDWETVFVINHIYPRFVYHENDPKTPFITSAVTFSCAKPKKKELDSKCERVRLSFEPTPFEDCMGRAFSYTDLRDEFEAILKSASWVIPNAQRCDDGPNRICVEGTHRLDVQRRIRGVTFRFGWSKQEKTDKFAGAGPYCLQSEKTAKRGILAGLLTPRAEYSKLPPIHFNVTQDPEGDFQFALYGSKKLLMGKRKNIQAHTPIGYYVVTNPALVGMNVPWNHPVTKNAINETFMKEGVYFTVGSNITNIFPEGLAATSDKGEFPRKPLEFVIPDYLPSCKKLAASLNESWKGLGNAKAVCKDVVSFVYEHVWTKKRDWDGFIVGVTSHDPGRNTVEYEYFSADSHDSWTYDYPKPKKLYYLSGVGQSIVTVDGERFCGLRPNLFGLGDIFVTDLLPCKRRWLAE